MRPYPWWRDLTPEGKQQRCTEKRRVDGVLLREYAEQQAAVGFQQTLSLRSPEDGTDPVPWPLGPSTWRTTLPGYGPLEKLERTVGVLCSLPDDPLDTAQDYAVGRLRGLRGVVTDETNNLMMDVLDQELELGLKALLLRVRAHGTPYEAEVERVGKQAESELRRLTRVAEQSALSARRTTYWMLRSVQLDHFGFTVLRATLLFAAAVIGWLASMLGEHYGADLVSVRYDVAVQLLIAFVVFVAIDQVFVARLLEPRIKQRRRALLKRSAKRAVKALRRADRDWAKANEVLTRSRAAGDSTAG